jgi:hypothetical protein
MNVSALVNSGPTEGGVGDALRAINSLDPLTALVPAPATIQQAYVDLHSRVQGEYLKAFKSLVLSKKNHYPEAFRKEMTTTNELLTGAASVLRQVIRLDDLSASLWASMQAAAALNSTLPPNWPASLRSALTVGDRPIGAASKFLTDSAGPFKAAFALYRRATVGTIDQMQAWRAPYPPGVFAGPEFWYQLGFVHLLVSTFALEAVYAALPASELYKSIDGSAGSRAAAIKLGARLVRATGKTDEFSDLLQFGTTAGSLETFTSRLWSALGVQDFRRPTDALVGQYVGLAGVLVDAELGTLPAGSVPRRLAARADKLASWGENGFQHQPKLAKHVPVAPSKGRVHFAPTWPVILEQPKEFTLVKGGKLDDTAVMHAEPIAQLGLFVAADIYHRIGEFLVDPKAKLQPDAVIVTAGSLEFGGHHEPHATHRSGVEFDLVEPSLRKLDFAYASLPTGFTGAGLETITKDATVSEIEYETNGGKFHKDCNRWLAQALAQPRVGPDVMPFNIFRSRTFDFYSTAPKDPTIPQNVPQRPVDPKEDVAKARAFTMSLWLSGADGILFADPWVFIDGWYRLRVAKLALDAALAAAGRAKENQMWPSSTTPFLEPYAHWNHWHADWSLLGRLTHDRNRALVKSDSLSPSVNGWLALWKALEVKRSRLTAILDGIEAKLEASLAGEITDFRKLLSQWDALPDFSTVPGLGMSLRQLVFDGPVPDGRWLRINCEHAQEQ